MLIDRLRQAPGTRRRRGRGTGGLDRPQGRAGRKPPRGPARRSASARVYVETTRPGGILTYVVGRVEDIRFRPGITGDDARHRDEIVAEYGPRIKAPAAVAAGKKGFTATVFVVQDEALRRHDLKVSPKGAIEDEVKTLVPDLPVPYTF